MPCSIKRSCEHDFPSFKVRETTLGYYEYDAGYVRPEKIIAVQIDEARKKGVVLQFDERVLAITSIAGGVSISTDKQNYSVQKVILAAGSWLGGFIPPEYQQLFAVYRQVLYWFALADRSSFDPVRTPVFIWQLPDGEGGIYGFPAVDGASHGVKVATHNMDCPRTDRASQSRGKGARTARVL